MRAFASLFSPAIRHPESSLTAGPRPKGRRLAGGLLAGLLVAASAVSASAQDLSAIEEAARKEGPMTWYVSFYGASLAEKAAAAFNAMHPGIEVKAVRATTGSTFQRLNQDMRANNMIASVVTMSGIGDYYDVLKKDGQLAEYTPKNAGDLIEAAKPAVVPGYVYPMGGGIMALAYNTKELQADAAPKTWDDLTDPKWKGKLAMGHPSFSGFDAALVVWLSDAKGWDFFRGIQANDPLIQRSTFDTLTSLTSGERLAGSMPDGVVEEAAAKGNPLQVVYPADGSLFILGFTAIMKDAPQPNTAKLFTEFLLSKEHAEIVADNYYHSVVKSVSRKLPDGRSLDDIELTPLLPSSEYGEKLKNAVEEWLDIFG